MNFIQDSAIIDKINSVLDKKKNCSIAATDGSYVDNALVAFYAEDLKLYFGAFTDTLKGRFIAASPQVAVNIDELQMHGMAVLLDRDTEEFKHVFERYVKKFPYYRSFFNYEKNELYRVDPLIYWIYDYKKGMMHRDTLVIDADYYSRLNPYEPPKEFKLRD